jgi:penicillin V acylase-like amidase (Ntn superfamily)
MKNHTAQANSQNQDFDYSISELSKGNHLLEIYGAASYDVAQNWQFQVNNDPVYNLTLSNLKKYKDLPEIEWTSVIETGEVTWQPNLANTW